MSTTEERKNQVSELFESKLELNKIYSRGELEILMDQVLDYHYNITTLTYNRWNKGMTYLCPILEHVDRAKYRYLGSNHPYTGKVYHYPQGEHEEFEIAQWNEGALTFNNETIQSFDEWLKSGYDGERVISLNTRCTVLMDGSRTLKFLVSDVGGTITEGYGHIRLDSRLGTLLKGKKQHEEFMWGDTHYKIISIDNDR